MAGEYLKKLIEDREKQKKRSSSTKDIAPLPEDRTWFQKGAFDDGYQFGDVTKTILSSGADISENITAGVLGMGERVVDAGAYLLGGAGNILGADEFAQQMQGFIQKDLYDEKAIAQSIILGNAEHSVFGEKSDALMQSAGQLGATIGLQAAGVPWWVTTGVTSFGGEVENAFNEGASYGEAGLSAAISAGAEILTEKISGGISFGGKTLDDALTKSIARGVSNKVVRTLTKLGVDMVGEGAEEVLSGAMSAIGQKMTYADNKTLSELFSREDALESFIGGAVLGGGSGGIHAVRSTLKGRDYTSGLTANEETVVNKLLKDRMAEEAKKEDGKSESEVYDEIMDALDKGEISIDTIEEVLGGDSYKAYKDTVEREKEVIAELEGLYEGEELKREIMDFMEKESKRGEAQTKLSSEVFDLVKDSRLAESYYEVGRRRESFKADPSEYSEKQRRIVQKAIDSGVLNNTRRAHILVDTLARIAEDKDVDFDFATNQKLKESGFAVEGADVNGYVVGNNITINMNSRKAWEFTVGHEITHVLEGTELYDGLRKALESYARGRKSKGGKFDNEYMERLYKVRQLYKGKDGYRGVDGFNNIKKEVIADLVGDYIFNDTDFIRHLSTKHRNVFEKIYDEIKYLAKVVTAGSEEARQIEKIKKAFEDAYRAEKSTATDGGDSIDDARLSDDERDVQYSLTYSDEIAHGQSNYLLDHKAFVTEEELKEAQRVTAAMVDVMMEHSSILPEDKIGKVLTKNGSYDISTENTTICVRTLAYNEFVDMVQEKIGRPLTQMESFLASQKLYDIATDPQCLYCYVSLDRKAFNDMLLRYMNDRDTVIEKYKASDRSPEAISKLYEEFLHGRKDTKQMKNRFDKWIGYVDNDTPLLSLADIATEERQSVIKANGGNLASQLADARAYAQSASWSKIQKKYVAYRDEILKLNDRVVKNLNEHYGLRWYSFSDYSAAFIVENMQQITDASIRGLKGLGYTKDTDFAEIFAPTGMNINVSVFVNTDENGNFYIDERQSADFEKALALREKYPNVGIVATVTNDEALRWAGEQEWSDVIIPFHIVRTGTDVAEYYKWLNYTAESGDTIGDKDLWNAYLDSLNLKSEGARKKVSKNIYPSEHKNDKATYLGLCDSRGLTPRFVRFAGEDWYMKLVNETRLSADESTALKPVFNEDAAKVSFEKFVDKGGYEGGWYKEGVNVDAEAQAVAEDVLAGKKANEVDYGRQDGYVPESLIAGRKANRTHARYSLSEDIAPVAENAATTLPDDFAPVRSDIDNKDVTTRILNGTRVRARDRGNIGTVQGYNEQAGQYAVSFRNKDGLSATVLLNPEELAPLAPTEAERYAKDVERINKKFAADKAALDEEFAAKREQLADKDAFISGKAAELYKELRGLKKGVRASEALGYLLDHGYEWSSIRAALVNIRYTPDRLVNQNSTIEDIARKMLDDEYESSQYDLEEEYQERLEALETEAAKKRHEAKRITRKELHANIIDRIKSAFKARGFDFDELLKSGKDLSTFATVDNTPQRVNEKTFGYKAGQILNDLTVNRVAQNETEGIKWLNTITGKKDGLLAQLSKEYGIKARSKESAAAQMYAEGFYVDENNEIIKYGDAELAADFPDASVQKRIKGLAGDTRLRQFYDETLKAINESRTRNGYAEIPRLANYFLHFRAMDDTFSRLGLPFNPNDIRAKDLPTDLNGVTADLKPGKPFFASEKHRMGKRTTFDILGGLERYATSAKNQIYHIDDIQNFRALRNYIADTFGQANGLSDLDAMSEEEAQQRIEEVFSSHLSNYAKFLNEEANILAGKTALIDRGLEGMIGRRAITFLKDLNGLVGRNMVGFNVSSSLTNFIPVAQTFAKTNKADFVKAFSQTVANKLRGGKLDNFAENSPVMIRRKGADAFNRTFVQKVADTGYTLMSAVDDISTELIARTKFNELTRKGMDEQKAHYETDKWVSRLMGDRSLGQMPQLYNSKMLGLITKFQLEVRNQLDSQFYDTIQEAKVSNEDIADAQTRNAKTAAKVASTFVQLAVAQHLFGKAFEAVAGYNPAFDIIEVLMTTFGWDDDEDDEDTALDNIGEGFLALLEDLPYASVVMDGGRIPLSSALPIGQFISGKDKYGNEKSRVETVAEALPYLLPTGGYGQIKKTYQGLSMFDDDLPITGSYTDSGNLRFPVEETPLNVAQAALFGQWASENAREYFDGEHNTLKENQIQELVDVDIPIREYWDYREGLAEQDTLEEKFDYIAGLDLPVAKKNILINNVVDRDEKVDLSNYDDFANFEEFDFAIKNPTKYAVAKASGGYASYKKHMDELKKIEADKNANGKSISGSRKKKVLKYINSIDADYGEKLIIYKHEYPADDTYNREIIEYLNNRNDISYEEMMVILQELGFIVSADGRVSWD